MSKAIRPFYTSKIDPRIKDIIGNSHRPMFSLAERAQLFADKIQLDDGLSLLAESRACALTEQKCRNEVACGL